MKRQQKKNKNEKAITLIALVVTIVVLLILAGVSIAMLSGENGIIKQAQEAKLETRGGEVEEKVKLWKVEHELNEYSKIDVLTENKFIEDLKSEKLVFDEEINTETKIITIGSREIYYGLQEPVNLITFSIDGTEYQAEEGMTWIEWCPSKYNTSGIYIVIGETVAGWMGPLDCNSSNEIRAGIAYVELRVTECVYPDSEILVNIDGKTVLAKDIKENQETVYFDFVENTTKIGKIEKVFIHKDATNFVKYTFADGSYLEATDYHPIYTKEGWKSQTERNGYEMPEKGDEVKTPEGWKVITKIETYTGLEDCYDFKIISEDGESVNNYFANGTLVQGSY